MAAEAGRSIGWAAPDRAPGDLPGPGRSAALAVLALALLLRLGWAIAVPVQPVSDSHAYDVFARNLALHGVYGWTPAEPSAYWPVGTSALYALLYEVFGPVHWPVAALNVLLGVATAWLAMRLATRWYGPRVALLTGLLLALWPSQIQFTTVLASELPFCLLLLAALVLWTREPLRAPAAVVTGFLLAGAAYVRPTALLVPVLLAGLALLRHVPPRRALACTALAVVAMGVALAPWALRNRRVFGEVVVVSTNAGANTWMGNNPATTGSYQDLPPEVAGMGELERDRYLAAEARRYVRADPGAFVKRTLVKLVRLHERESIGVAWNPGVEARYGAGVAWALKLLANLFWWAALALALGGAILLFRRDGWGALFAPPLVLWGYFAVVHAVTVVQDRYHFPSVPFIAMLAALALAAPLQARGARPPPAPRR